MTFEISLHPFFAIPRVLQTQKDDSRQHWVGQASPTPQKRTEKSRQEGSPRREGGDEGYRPLTEIKLGDVKDAFKYFENQLVPVHENWVGENCFCSVTLKRIRDGRPPMIFGRVKACFPSDGYIDNVDELELLFPLPNRAIDKVRVYREDISQYSQKSAQSYHVRVQVKASEQDEADFAGSAPLFSVNGFYPEFDPDYYDILEMNDQNYSAYPWLYVIGSRWFDSVPDSLYAEVKAKLKDLTRWGKQIFNYHPDWLPIEVNPLNKVLGYKLEITPTFLTEPSTPQETAFLVNKLFERHFMPTETRQVDDAE